MKVTGMVLPCTVIVKLSIDVGCKVWLYDVPAASYVGMSTESVAPLAVTVMRPVPVRVVVGSRVAREKVRVDRNARWRHRRGIRQSREALQRENDGI